MRTTGGVDREMLVSALDSYDSIYEKVARMELLTLEVASGVHPDDMVVRLDETAEVRDNHETSGPASPFILLFDRMDLLGHMTAVRIHLISWIWVIRRCPGRYRGFDVESRF